MNVEKLILTLDEIKENEISEETKLAWINEVEGRIACEIHKKKAEEFKAHTSRDGELSVIEPYSRLYILYLVAMIALSKGEYEIYTDTMIRYETAFSEYAKYVIRHR